MGNLLVSLFNSAKAMQVFDRQLAVIQNNVTNANTPGYVRQLQTIEAMPFEMESGQMGGVKAGPVLSSRSAYAEQSVRAQMSLLGQSEQKASDLAQVEPLFDLAENFGISGALNDFFQSFSQLSVNPNDAVARQAVIDRANEVAQSFNQAAAGLSNAAGNADRQTVNVVTSINTIAAQIRDLNAARRTDFNAASDAGMDAKMYSALEQLSEFVDFTVLQEQDGTFSVYLGGQTPLVLGDHQFEIQADVSSPETAILDSSGRDITGQISAGRLHALIDEKNTVIPGYLSDLNQLAQTFSDTVNLKLRAGVDANGAPPAVDLFSYDASVGAAISMAVTDITPDQIAAASAAAPGGNSNALDLAALVDAKVINGFTFTEYFGNIGARVGRDLATAQGNRSTQQALVSQARNLRDETSAVSFDEEAARLLQVQRAYQAAGTLLGVLNQITDTLMQVMRV
jgi:flagellar hook-associated protein 1 FlgK